MLDRCNNPNSTAYKYYGGMGVRVCKEWEDDFSIFYNWAVKSGYDEDLTIERKNINGDYCPDNCTWIPMTQQARNSRQCHYQTINGKRLCLAEIARKYDVPYGTVKDRYAHGKRGNQLFEMEEDYGN